MDENISRGLSIGMNLPLLTPADLGNAPRLTTKGNAMKIEEITLERQELELAVRLLDVDSGGAIAMASVFEGRTSVTKSTRYGDFEMTVDHEGRAGGHTITIKKTYKS